MGTTTRILTKHALRIDDEDDDDDRLGMVGNALGGGIGGGMAGASLGMLSGLYPSFATSAQYGAAGERLQRLGEGYGQNSSEYLTAKRDLYDPAAERRIQVMEELPATLKRRTFTGMGIGAATGVLLALLTGKAQV